MQLPSQKKGHKFILYFELFGLLIGLPIGFAQADSDLRSCRDLSVGRREILSFSKESGFPVKTQISSDGKTLIYGSATDGLTIRSLENGHETKIPMAPDFESVQISADGRSLLINNKSTFILRNLDSGVEKTFNEKGGAQFLPNSRTFASLNYDTQHSLSIRVRNPDTGREQSYGGLIPATQNLDLGSEALLGFSPDGKFLALRGKSQTILKDLETGKEQKLGPTDRIQFSQDGKKILTFAVATGQAAIRDLNEKKDTLLFRDTRTQDLRLSPDGGSVSARRSVDDAMGSGNLTIQNLLTRKETTYQFENDIQAMAYSPSNALLALGTWGVAKVQNSLTGKSVSFPHTGWVDSVLFTPDGNTLMTTTELGEVRLTSLQSICAEFNWVAQDSTACVDCPKNPVLPIEPNLAAIRQQARCGEPFDEKVWDSDLPLDGSKIISRETSRNLLLRFQKPGGFDPQKHLPALIAILRSDFPKREPDLILGALQGVLHRSNLLYEELFRYFPELTWLKASSDVSPDRCRTADEIQIIEKSAITYLDDLTHDPGRANWDSWSRLAPLAPLFSHLSPSRRDEYADIIAQSLADHAADDRKFSGVFLSKLYKFTYQAASKLLGQSTQPLTDLTLIRESDQLKPLILSSRPLGFEANTPNAYGFYSRSLSAIAIPAQEVLKKNPGEAFLVKDQVYQWETGGQKYQAKLSVSANLSHPALIPKGRAPNYAELWKGGTLTGVVITGTNLKGIAAGVMDQYLSYYQGEGFHFQAPISIQDTAKFLKDQIESGELRYLIKEAHSDGDEKNLFRLDSEARLLRGEKQLSDGKRERVYLIFPGPSAGVSKAALLPNQEFGSWIQARERNGQGQLVYFNTSCWSKTKAIHEIEAAQSATLLNIPSTTTVNVFENEPKNAERILFTAFRQGKSYENLRAALKKNPNYSNNTGNHFIFPDEDSYQSSITQVLKTPLKIDLRIIGPEGRAINIDEGH